MHRTQCARFLCVWRIFRITNTKKCIWNFRAQCARTLTPVAPDDTLRSYEAKWSICARNWTLFTTLLPVIQSFRQTGKSDYFPQTASFWQFVSITWLDNDETYTYTKMFYMSNAYKVNKLVFFTYILPLYLSARLVHTCAYQQLIGLRSESDLFLQFSDCWRNWSTEWVNSSQDHIYRYFGSFPVGVTVVCLKVSL